MRDDFQEYGRYFQPGLRLEVGIPLSGQDMFRDWAIVAEYDEDLLVVDLSRDELPRGVAIGMGTILEVGVWRGREVYTCRAIVTEKDSGKTVRMRLLGAVILKDRRQFYRLNVSLRVRYSIPPEGTSAGRLVTEWERRRRREMEALRIRSADYDEPVQKLLMPRSEDGAEWHDRPHIRTVLGGGGIGFRIHCRLKPGQLIHLELHLPLFPFRIVHAIAEVAFVLDGVRVPEHPDPVYHTGLRFHSIDERDRDYLVEFVSQVELERLREMSERRQVREGDEMRLDEEARRARTRRTVVNMLFVVFFLLVVYLLTAMLVSYKSRHGENEIGKDFTNSLK